AAFDPATLDDEGRELRRLLHETIAKVGDDFGRRYTFNPAIAAIMEFCNHLARYQGSPGATPGLCQEAWLAVIRLIGPVTPHIAEALWQALGQTGSLFEAGWPEVDPSALVRQSVTVVVQVNGKVRGRVELPPGSSREQIEQLALAEDNVQRFVADQTIRRVIVVPDKLVNIVVA
ncbi:MAG: class I tRNA ligase family protein, partial [Wenzhouxiangella sp.]|nr:class I tRNA ligase family protein [Wenzhouxiangella sp.]